QPRPGTARRDGRHRRADLGRGRAVRRQLEPVPRAQGGGTRGCAAGPGGRREAGRRGQPHRPGTGRAAGAPGPPGTGGGGEGGAERWRGLKGGTPRILLGGKKDRAEDTGGDNAHLADRHREQALAAAAARERIEVLQPLTVKLPPTHLPADKAVVRVDAATVGYEPGRPGIRDLSFAITGPERVAVPGPNGSGETTLLTLGTRRLDAWAGTDRGMTGGAAL